MSNYYDLPHDKRWLFSDDPNTIGGRATDIEAIYDILKCKIEHFYESRHTPIPDFVRVQTECLRVTLDFGSELIQNLITTVTLDAKKENNS